jgi:hypothetical protein
VTDPQGKTIAGAAVTVANSDGSLERDTKTDASGNFSVTGLPPGDYLIAIQADGFEPTTSNAMTLAVGQTLTFNQQVKGVKSESQTITVQGGGTNSIELDTATISGTIANQKVNDMPLNGRNFSSLVTTTAGVSNQSGQDEAKVGVAGSAKFSVNGGRVEYNTFLVDGSDVLNTGINASRGQGEPLLVYPSIDAIQDMQVLTSNYGAMYGKTASGAVLVTTKSGLAKFHGDIYGFIRNEMFNARNYFDQPGRQPLYRRQDYGGTIGGPLYIPGRYNTQKNKTFFFFSEELRLEKTPVAYNQAVPTVAERSGDFSDVCPNNAATVGAYYPTAYPDCPVVSPDGTGKNPGFLYAHADVNYDAQAILNSGIIPLPNSTSGCNTGNTSSFPSCYDASVSPATYWREELFRIDHNLTPNQELSFRYIHDSWNTTTLTPQWGIVSNSFPTIENKLVGPGIDLVLNLAGPLPHTILNRVTLAYSAAHITLAPEAGPGVTSLARPALLDDASPTVTGGAAVAGESSCSMVTASASATPPATAQQLVECPMGYIFNNGFGGKIPALIFQGNNAAYGGHGFAADTGYAPWHMSNPTFLIRDDLSKSFGKHTFEFGVEMTLVQQNELSAANGANSGDMQGVLTFSNQQSKNSSNNAFADFLTGPGIVPVYVPPGSPSSVAEYGGSTTAIKSYQQDSGQGAYYDRYKIAELYLQDDWKVTNRLTITAGIRASLFGTWYNAKNTAYNWEPGSFNQSVAGSVHIDPYYGFLVTNLTGSPLPLVVPGQSSGGGYSLQNLSPAVVNGLVQCGVNGVPRSCMTSHVFNPAPRFGFAWDPTGKGKTSIRGGYGLFWEHGTSYEANTGSLIGGAPLILSETQSNPGPIRSLSSGQILSETDPGGYNEIGFSCQDGSSQCGSYTPQGGVTFPLNVTSIPSRAVYPYTQQWSLSVQRQMGTGTVASVAYVGTKGTHLTAERDLNQLQPLANSLNPFPLGQPITNGICQSGALNGVFPTLDPTTTTGVSTVSGIGPSQPGFINMEIACTGFPGFDYGPSAGANSHQVLSISPDTVRQYTGLSNILSIANIANSNYHGFQATLHRTSGPLQLGAAYSFSHSLDEASDRASDNFADSLNIKSNYASSDFDERQLLSIDYTYDLSLIHLIDQFSHAVGDISDSPDKDKPQSAWQNLSLVKTLLDKWQLAGIVAYQSGTPFSIVNAGSASGIGAADNAGVGDAIGIGSFADRIGNPKGLKPNTIPTIANKGPLLLNPGAFSAPRGLTFGDSGRNSVNNPSRTNFNMSLLKHFSAGGENNLEFRAEAFNVFNHTQFRLYDPVHPGSSGNNVVNCYGPEYAQYSAGFTGDENNKSCVTGNSFLHPVDAHDPRIMQFGLKLAF